MLVVCSQCRTRGAPLTYPRKQPTARQVGLRAGFRSGLEESVAAQLQTAGTPFEYETVKLRYRVDETRSYTPDFLLLSNGILVETKGVYSTQDRKKTRLVREQHPDIELRLVFSNSRTRISKQSKTTYGMWCDHQGILYADKTIPAAWLTEPPNRKSLAALERLKATP